MTTAELIELLKILDDSIESKMEKYDANILKIWIDLQKKVLKALDKEVQKNLDASK